MEIKRRQLQPGSPLAPSSSGSAGAAVKRQGGSAYRMVKMEPESQTVWRTRVDEDLKGKFYTFNVKIDADVWRGDTPGLAWQRL